MISCGWPPNFAEVCAIFLFVYFPSTFKSLKADHSDRQSLRRDRDAPNPVAPVPHSPPLRSFPLTQSLTLVSPVLHCTGIEPVGAGSGVRRASYAPPESLAFFTLREVPPTGSPQRPTVSGGLLEIPQCSERNTANPCSQATGCKQPQGGLANVHSADPGSTTPCPGPQPNADQTETRTPTHKTESGLERGDLLATFPINDEPPPSCGR